jgi:hypothetical protein
MFVSNLKGLRAFTQYNVIIKNMTSQSILLFSPVKITLFVIFTVKITGCEDINFIQRINYSISPLKM